MSVRDYELDSFGVINNAVYQNYLEHTRHQFLESQGLKLTAYLEQGLSPELTILTQSEKFQWKEAS